MFNGLVRDVTIEEVETYERDGVVKLTGVLPLELVETLGHGIDQALSVPASSNGVQTYNVSAVADQMKVAGEEVLTDARAEAIVEERRGRFLTMIGAHTINDTIRDIALDSTLAYVASRLFRTHKVNFYDDQTLSKEASSREYTAFHTDEPYYHLEGDQVCGMWISPDIVTPDSGAMRYVRGSHHWGSFFRPNTFIGRTAINSEEDYQVQLPDIEGDEAKYDIVTYPSNPGDVIVHHSNVIHGAGPNYSADTRRQAVSFRYAGDKVRYKFHKSAPPQPHHRHALRDGDILDCDQFPVVWRAPR